MLMMLKITFELISVTLKELKTRWTCYLFNHNWEEYWPFDEEQTLLACCKRCFTRRYK